MLLRIDPPLCSASVLSLSSGSPLEVLPSHRNDRFPRFVQQPGISSRRLNAGGRPPSKQVSDGLFHNTPANCCF